MKILGSLGVVFSLVSIGIGLYNHESFNYLMGWFSSAIWATNYVLSIKS